MDAGPSTEGNRLALLQSHRRAVRAHLNEVEEALGAIEHKIVHYGGSRTP